MKKGLAVIIIAAIMLTACILEIIYVHNTFTKMDVMVESLLVEIDKDEENVKRAQTLDKANEIKNYWDKRKRLTEIMLNHILLIEYDARITRVKSNIETNERELSVIDGDQLQKMTKQLKELHTPHFHNIL